MAGGDSRGSPRQLGAAFREGTCRRPDDPAFNGEVILRVLKAHPDMFQQHLGGLLN